MATSVCRAFTTKWNCPSKHGPVLYRAGTNVVFLDPDVAKAFADSASVNQALRLLLQLARTNVSLDSQPAKAVQPTSRAQRRAKRPKPLRATRG